MEYLGEQCAAQSVGATNQLITLLIQTIVSTQCSISPNTKWPPDHGPTILKNGLQEYDYIVVGAGSAGSVVASRLSENPNMKVLLLEAGDNPPIESEIPALGLTTVNTTYDWKYYAQKSKYYGSSLVRGISYPRGKMLGGTGSMNAMFYVRGHQTDYNNWAAGGNPTWGWKNVTEYFKKSENMLNRTVANAYGGIYHSTKGPQYIASYNNTERVKRLLMAAKKELKIKELIDFNAVDHIGFAESTGTIAGGTRQSSAKAFLIPAGSRPNLHIVKNARVSKLTIEGSDTVKGVNFELKGRSFEAKARKEYVLSAGVFNTPQILLLSGIGPAFHLRQFHIPVRQDLSVGRNLQDHATVPLFIKIPTNVSLDALTELKQYLRYLIDKTGPFSYPGVLDVIEFVNIHSPNFAFPDTQYHYVYFKRGQRRQYLNYFNRFGFSPEFIESMKSHIDTHDVLICAILLLNPDSRGSVELRSPNFLDPVKIFPNFLQTRYDIQSLQRAIRREQRLLKTSVFRRAKAKAIIPDIPACDEFVPDSDKYWRCYIKELTISLFHPVGTAKMGHKKDPDTVVTPEGRVTNMKNLFVADASIMPYIPSGNTNAPAIMIGEKISDFIKNAS